MVDWQEVLARRNKGRLNNKGEAKGYEDVTKFFVSNLPNGCIPGEVSEFFGCFGEVVGSYIARKRDKEGNRFGFVTFRKVSSTADLVRRMNSVKMGSCRLKVNVTKFAMENIGRREVEEKAGRMHNTKVPVGRKQDEFVVEREKTVRHSQSVGMSFKDILEGKPSVSPGFQSVPSNKSIKVPDNVVAFYEIRGKALVGRVRDLKTLTCMNKILVEYGFGGFDIVYVGGLSLLLNFHSNDEAMEFLLKKDVWVLWFSVLDLWEGQPLSFERVAWIKIHGVPINLAINEVFDDIANQFEKIIHPSQLCLEEGDISVGYVGVLVGDGEKINDSMILRWKNKTFKTWITEETRVWDPECVGTVAKRKEETFAADNCFVNSPDLVHARMPESGGVENEKVDDLMEEGEIRASLHGEEVENQRLHGETHGTEVNAALEHNEMDLNLGVGVEFIENNLENIVKVDLFNKSADKPHLFSTVRNGPKPNYRPNKIKIRKRNQRVHGSNISPVESSRPRKRNRQAEDDPFDLDRFIGILQEEESAEGPYMDSNCNKIDVGDLDLNNPAHDSVISVNSSSAQIGGLEEVENGVESVAVLDKEVEETIKIGVALGMDLAEHKDLVKNSIVVEGGSDKVPWLSKLKYEHGVDFLAVQETMVGDLSHFDGKRIWGNNNYDKEFVGSVGQSGGLLCMWDKGLFTQFASIKNRFFLLVSGKLKGSNEIVNIMNVYAPQGVAAKQDLWLSIESLVLSTAGMWVLLGDFNAVRIPEERNSIKRWKVEMLKDGNELEVAANADIESLELDMETRGLSDEEEWIYVESKKILKELEVDKHSDIKQRSRVRWALDGDENSRFFHGIVGDKTFFG
ncbi:RNA-directed DNA polymerase, eukaryota [Artemisia annua]|uniref:RNA-directed DNA polymerase, eukaryota n=1 Tax=Artemisia annua TaxID=35608 RepID=A0A2U1Q7P2_ARTAN|nr:RNA-directed DNA polymerase, eukaryota [Artemisia annua]